MPAKPKYQIGDIILTPKKICDVKIMANLFDDTEEYIYNLEGLWVTEKELLDSKGL